MLGQVVAMWQGQGAWGRGLQRWPEGHLKRAAEVWERTLGAAPGAASIRLALTRQDEEGMQRRAREVEAAWKGLEEGCLMDGQIMVGGWEGVGAARGGLGSVFGTLEHSGLGDVCELLV